MMIRNIVTSLKGMISECEHDVEAKEPEICRARLMSIRQFLIAALKTYDAKGNHESQDEV